MNPMLLLLLLCGVSAAGAAAVAARARCLELVCTPFAKPLTSQKSLPVLVSGSNRAHCFELSSAHCCCHQLLLLPVHAALKSSASTESPLPHALGTIGFSV
jgi:hypothetical protein